MALHTSIQCGFTVVNTGGTFGDNTSPSNFDPSGLSRRCLSRFLWKTCSTLKERFQQFLPEPQTAAPPTPEEGATFVPADSGNINTGALDENSDRLPPPHNVHVDDALCADVAEFLFRTIWASVGGLFEVLGLPDNPLVHFTLSLDKFEAWHNHLRKLVGHRFNSRTLSVGMLPYKKDRLLSLLLVSTQKESFELIELAHLLAWRPREPH